MNKLKNFIFFVLSLVSMVNCSMFEMQIKRDFQTLLQKRFLVYEGMDKRHSVQGTLHLTFNIEDTSVQTTKTLPVVVAIIESQDSKVITPGTLKRFGEVYEMLRENGVVQMTDGYPSGQVTFYRYGRRFADRSITHDVPHSVLPLGSEVVRGNPLVWNSLRETSLSLHSKSGTISASDTVSRDVIAVNDETVSAAELGSGDAIPAKQQVEVVQPSKKFCCTC